METATDTDREFAAYKKSTGCTCDRKAGEMHSEECPLYPQMMAAIERKEQMRREFLESIGEPG